MYTVQCTLNSAPLLHFSAAPGHLHSADLAPAQAVLDDKLIVVMQHLHLVISAVHGHIYFCHRLPGGLLWSKSEASMR